MRIITTSRYERAMRKLMSEEDRRAMEAVIVADPGAAPVIPAPEDFANCAGRVREGVSEVESARCTSVTRVLTDAIYLLTAYAKADREDLSPADRKALSRLMAAIKKEETDR